MLLRMGGIQFLFNLCDGGTGDVVSLGLGSDKFA